MTALQVNGIDINYEIAGAGAPIIFIHGLGSGLRDWERQIPIFSEHFQTIAVDMRGHGKSQKPGGPYSMALFAGDLAGLIDSLGVAPVHVVGISLGGMVAFQLALDHPNLVRSLVIVNAGPEVVARTLTERWNVFVRFAIVYLLGMRKMGEFLSRRIFPKEEHAEIRKIFVERWAENDLRAYADSLRAIVGWSVADRIDGIRKPTLVVAAEHDYTPVSAKQAYVRKMPNAKLIVISDSHHATPVDQPEIFNQSVLEFLSNR